MKILVTGGCGLLGRAILKACGDSDEAVVLDRVDDAIALGGVKGDVTDIEAVLDAAAGCDAIIHTAALHGANRRTSSTADFIRTNVGGADNVFQAALRHGIRRVVVASSLEVVVGIDWAASGMTVLDELSPPRPDWIYPVTKLQVENLGSFYSRIHGLQVAQLRYAAIENKTVDELGYELLTRVITPHDAATATLAAVHKKELRDEVFSVGPNAPFAQADINEAMAGGAWNVLERYWPGCQAILPHRIGPPQPEHFWPVTRIDKIKLMLGWRPQHTFDAYLRKFGWDAGGAGSRSPVAATLAR